MTTVAELAASPAALAALNVRLALAIVRELVEAGDQVDGEALAKMWAEVDRRVDVLVDLLPRGPWLAL